MPAAATETAAPQYTPPSQIGEWFWRFLAVVMLVVVGWVVWIALQISPPAIVLPAAYKAAAEGRASRNSAGLIGAPPAATAAAPAAPATGAASDAAAAPVAAAPATGSPPVIAPAPAPVATAEPPVNVDKLKLADSIETPIVPRVRRPAKPAPDAAK